MKWLFSVLLVLNLAYLGWTYLQPPAEVQAVDRAATQAPVAPRSLLLLAEVPPAVIPTAELEPEPPVDPVDSEPVTASAPANEPSPQPVAAVETPPPAPALVCYEATDLEKRSDLEVLKAKLQQNGIRLWGEGERQTTRKNYWVMLPPFRTIREAEAAAAKVEKARAGDFYLIRTGEFTNAVSLGVFSTPEAAKRRAAQYRSLKLKTPNPRIEEIELPAKRFWLGFVLNEAIDPVELSLSATVTRPVDCPPAR